MVMVPYFPKGGYSRWIYLGLIIVRFFGMIEPVKGQYTSIFTHIPSVSAGQMGVAVWVKAPVAPRFQSGAPVAIYLPGGFKGEGIGDKEAGLVHQGFIEISFNFPGNGIGEKQSGGGPYDHRGVGSLRAACDVIRFALGLVADMDGQSFSDLVNPIVPLHTNVGLIGYSLGGSTNICIAGVHGHEISGLAWILNWESPVGDGMPQAEAGAKLEGKLRPLNQETNPAYDPDTGVWDLSTLAYDGQVRIPLLDNTDEFVTGGLYFDFNGDGTVNTGSDFIPYPLVFQGGNDYRAHYSVRLRRRAHQENLFPDPFPPHLPSLAETESFWGVRNGEYWVDSTLYKIPGLMFMVVGSEIDHVQRALDHPHILLQYDAFRRGGARFVRVNPDRSYVETILGHSAPGAVDNDGFAPFDHSTIRDAVEPGSFDEELGRDVIVPAGACELADRSQFVNLEPQLHDLLTHVEVSFLKPKRFLLYQNVPNPFNPTTVIEYWIPSVSFVNLDILNILGQKVRVLVNEVKPAGTHSVFWDGQDNFEHTVVSGLYYYKLSLGDQHIVKRMTLLK